jgi:uncharacterized protein YbjT (DUF2867 family)
MEKKIIAVLGATGAQGGSLIRAMLNDTEREFTPRALTRNPNSDKAKELTDLGVEVVFADVDDEESIRNAFDGAYGAYCVTFFWEHFSPEKEAKQIAAFCAWRSIWQVGLKPDLSCATQNAPKWTHFPMSSRGG